MATIYRDVFGSCRRRSDQLEKDDAERARPAFASSSRPVGAAPKVTRHSRRAGKRLAREVVGGIASLVMFGMGDE